LKKIKKSFSEELNKSLFHKYNRKVTTTFFVNEFNLRAHGTKVIAYETGRKWLKGIALPQTSKIQVLVEWLGLDPKILFDINSRNDHKQESDPQFNNTLDISDEHRSLEAIYLIANQLTHNQRHLLLFTALTAQYFSEKKNFIFDYDYFIKKNSLLLQGTESHDLEQVLALKSSKTMAQAFQVELQNYRKGGSAFWNELDITSITNNEGEFMESLGIQGDINETTDIDTIPEKGQHIEHFAYYDTLTGLPNCLLLNDRINQAIVSASRYKAKMALLFVDYDDFKTINSQYGHTAGDAFLVDISLAMSSMLRRSDTLARLGGDEFIILMPEISRVSPINILLDKILEACNNPVPHNTDNLQISASIGCAVFNGEIDKDMDAQDLLHNAHQAMHLAKKSGKNKYHILDQLTD